MVKVLLNLQGERLFADAADALAVALTHAHMSATAARAGVGVAALRRR
jgi:crossover junction endodeoxyribonuclease RuvC